MVYKVSCLQISLTILVLLLVWGRKQGLLYQSDTVSTALSVLRFSKALNILLLSDTETPMFYVLYYFILQHLSVMYG